MAILDPIKRSFKPYEKQIEEVVRYFLDFLRSPVQTIKHTPQWPWPQLLLLFVTLASVTGTLSGIVSMKVSQIVFGMILFPISSLIGGSVLSAFFYYTFQLIYKRDTNFKSIFTTVTLALIPFFALYSLSQIIPLLQLVGFAFTGVLLIVGLTENVKIERKKVTRIVIALYLTYAAITIANMIRWETENRSYKNIATPESYDQLLKEFKSDDK